MGSRHREVREREIAFLQDNGVPAGFLLDADELDRLVGSGQLVAPAERR
jgi:hypothetical protein